MQEGLIGGNVLLRGRHSRGAGSRRGDQANRPTALLLLLVLLLDTEITEKTE